MDDQYAVKMVRHDDEFVNGYVIANLCRFQPFPANKLPARI
jgi:hypothetical protein